MCRATVVAAIAVVDVVVVDVVAGATSGVVGNVVIVVVVTVDVTVVVVVVAVAAVDSLENTGVAMDTGVRKTDVVSVAPATVEVPVAYCDRKEITPGSRVGPSSSSLCCHEDACSGTCTLAHACRCNLRT